MANATVRRFRGPAVQRHLLHAGLRQYTPGARVRSLATRPGSRVQFASPLRPGRRTVSEPVDAPMSRKACRVC